jgi:hypothetical protein
MALQVPAPLGTIIRGHVFDFSSVTMSVEGKTQFCSFQEIHYTWSRDIGILRGNGSTMKKGRTRGEFQFEGSITMAREDATPFHRLLASLGFGSFGEAVFDLIVTYSDRLQNKPDTDTLIGCTITSSENAHSRSPDPLTVSYDIDIMDIKYNGFSPAAGDSHATLQGTVAGVGASLLGR